MPFISLCVYEHRPVRRQSWGKQMPCRTAFIYTEAEKRRQVMTSSTFDILHRFLIQMTLKITVAPCSQCQMEN